jgi:hypothetical protein
MCTSTVRESREFLPSCGRKSYRKHTSKVQGTAMADAATSESWRCSDRALTLRDEAFTPARGSTPKTPKRLSRTRDSRSASPYETAWRSKGPRQPSCRVAVLPKPSNDVQLLQIWTCLPGITVHGTSGPILVSHRQTLVERSYRISWQGVPRS